MVALGACSSGTNGSGTSGGTGSSTSGGTSGVMYTEAQACADEGAAYCALLSQCDPAKLTFDFGSTAECVARRVALCASAVSALGSSRTPNSVEACAKARANEPCSSFLINNPPAACAVDAGTQTGGAACAFADQCLSTFCSIPAGHVCGTCAPAPKVGSACSVDHDCGPGLVCGPISETCVLPVANAAACSEPNGCVGGYDCVGIVRDAGGGNCAPYQTTVGGVCDYRSATASTCDPTQGLFCLRTSCVAHVYADAGATCGLPDGGNRGCAGGGNNCILSGQQVDCHASRCVDKAGVATCKPFAADGTACDTLLGPACEPPALCVTSDAGTAGVCSLPGATACH